MLSAGAVTVASGSVAKDIEFDAALSWTSTHRLTLDSYRTIAFNRPIDIAGKGALTITTNDGGMGGDFRFFGKGHIQFRDLRSNLTINGNSYILFSTLKHLAQDLKHSPNEYYALATSIDVAKTSLFQDSLIGFQRYVRGIGQYNLRFDHCCHFIRHECCSVWYVRATRHDTRHRTDIDGVAGHASGQGVAPLVGYNLAGFVLNSYATGQVSAIGATVMAGLVGESDDGKILNSYAAVEVSGSAEWTGGLVGFASGDCTGQCDGIIQQSYATGSMTAGDGSSVGGLVGGSDGAMILDSMQLEP